MIDDLLDLASTLASGANGSGRPKSIELRRAASTAYYGLFHALSQLCASELIGASKAWTYYTPIYRSLEHAKVRQVLDQFRKGDPASTLAAVSLTFSQLQDARYDADYNPEPFRFKRTGVIDLISAGRQAVQLLRELPTEQKLLLAVRLVAVRKRSA